MTQAQTEDLILRLDSQHEELIRRLDELDRQIESVLATWAPAREEVAASSVRQPSTSDSAK